MATVNDFIIDMELSAKRILRDVNRRQKEASRREEFVAGRALKNDTTALKKSNSAILIPSVTDRLDKKVGMLGTTAGSTQGLGKTRVLQYSIPRMVVTMGTSKLDEEYNPSQTKTMGMSPRQLSPIQKWRNGSSSAKRAQSTKSKVYEKLDSSPFLSQSTPSLQVLLEKKKVTDADLGNIDLEAPTKQTDWALKIHASSVFAGKTKSKKTFGHSMPTDAQGPIDWSTEGLRAKYRGEEQREEAWQAWQDASAFASTAVDDEALILPVTKMERHPIYVLYNQRLEYENAMSRYRTKNRLRMKRFVMDVQEVWLTNLKHLQEHQPMDNFFNTPSGGRPSTDGGHSSRPRQSLGGCQVPIAVGSDVPLNREEGWSEGIEQDQYGVEGSGLSRRRDAKAITNMHCQIQSVSHERALEPTFHTADVGSFPEPDVSLDYIPAVPPKLGIAPAVPFELETLVSGIVTKTVSGRPIVISIDRLVPPKPTVELCDEDDFDNQFSNDSVDTGEMSAKSPNKRGASLRKKKSKPKKKQKYVSGSKPVLPDEPHGASVWRITVVRMEDGRVRHHYASESFVDAFVSSAMADSGFLSHVTDFARGEKDLILFSGPHDLRWGRSEVSCHLSIRVIYPEPPVNAESTFEELRDKARVAIVAELGTEYEHSPPLVLTLSAIEFLASLNIPVENYNGVLSPLIDKDPNFSFLVGSPWWQCLGGEDVNKDAELLVGEPQIEKLLSLLVVPTGEFNDEGDAIPASLCLRDDSDLTDGKSSMASSLLRQVLSKTKALSFAHYLVGLVSVDFQELSISVSFAKRASSSSVSLQLIPWGEALVVASGGGDIPGLVRRPRFQASLLEGKAGDIDPPDGIVYTGGLYHNDVTPNEPYASLEDIADDVTPLSIRVSGGFPRMDQVPGSIICGVTKGPWFTYPLHRERTKVSANMFRDQHLSSTDSVLVNVTHALDTAILAPIQLSWENHSEIPVRAPVEPVSGAYVSMRMAPPTRLLSESLVSPLEDRNNPTVMAFNDVAELDVDYVIPTGLKPPRGMWRRFPDVDEKGFRRKKSQYLLGVDRELPTIVFGVTKLGALPNSTGVHTRNVWHAAVAVTDHINRTRDSKDYHYIVHNETHQGANNPATFHIKLKAEKFFALGSSSFATFEKKYDFIKEAREKFARKLALDAKIENSEVVLKTRDKELAHSIRNAEQRYIDKKMRKAHKSEIGWRQRYYHSTLMEVVDNWERRRDDRSGMYFFHEVVDRPRGEKEEFFRTCQWEVPMNWDRDLMLEVGSHGDPGPGASSAGGEENAFEEPGETWVPDLSCSRSFVQKDYKTPGIRAAPPKKKEDYAREEQMLIARSDHSSTSAHVSSAGSSSAIPAAGDERSGIDAHDPNKTVDNIAKELLQNDELMKALCRRLGLPDSNVVAQNQLIPPTMPEAIDRDGVSTVSSLGDASSIGFHKTLSVGLQIPPLALSGSQMNTGGIDPRNLLNDGEPKLSMGKIRGGDDDVDPEDPFYDSDEDDLWSDEEQQVGNFEFEGENEIGDLPQNHRDVALLRAKKKREEKLTGDGIELKQATDAPDSVPFINLEDNGLSSSCVDAGAVKAKGWRKLPRPELPSNFFQKCTQVRTMGPDAEAADTLNNPVFLLPISPVDACNYIPENFAASVESIFIHDARKDMERVIATIDRNIQKEEQLAVDLPTDDLLLFGEAKDMTTVDTFVANQYKQDRGATKDAKQAAIDKAILAAKSSNLAQMEDALEEDIPVNSIDQFGNTLFILAAQQGSKRMCKFLMRRGANINAQNLVGNTAMHYCYAYHHDALGAYLKTRVRILNIIN